MKIKKSFKILFSLSFLFLIFAFLYQYVYLPSQSLKNTENCTPLNFHKENVENEYFLFWSTKGECSGYVKYGTKEDDFPYLSLDLQGIVKIKEHKVKLNGIEKGDRYFFVIFSDEKMYGKDTNPMEIEFN